MTAPQLPPDRGWMGDPKRGAALGRVSSTPPLQAPRFYLSELRLDAGGYDAGGTYWGVGRIEITSLSWRRVHRMYRAVTADGAAEMFFRADDREQARAKVLERYPGARFYR